MKKTDSMTAAILLEELAAFRFERFEAESQLARDRREAAMLAGYSVRAKMAVDAGATRHLREAGE